MIPWRRLPFSPSPSFRLVSSEPLPTLDRGEASPGSNQSGGTADSLLLPPRHDSPPPPPARETPRWLVRLASLPLRPARRSRLTRLWHEPPHDSLPRPTSLEVPLPPALPVLPQRPPAARRFPVRWQPQRRPWQQFRQPLLGRHRVPWPLSRQSLRPPGSSPPEQLLPVRLLSLPPPPCSRCWTPAGSWPGCWPLGGLPPRPWLPAPRRG